MELAGLCRKKSGRFITPSLTRSASAPPWSVAGSPLTAGKSMHAGRTAPGLPFAFACGQTGRCGKTNKAAIPAKSTRFLALPGHRRVRCCPEKEVSGRNPQPPWRHHGPRACGRPFRPAASSSQSLAGAFQRSSWALPSGYLGDLGSASVRLWAAAGPHTRFMNGNRKVERVGGVWYSGLSHRHDPTSLGCFHA
jgi:hypothetical protein